MTAQPPAPNTSRWVWILFALNTAARLGAACSLPILYKEAYYWEWSFFLAPGYLDHPPLVAWMIWASTGLLGSQELWAIRLLPVLFGTASLLLVRHIAFQLFADRKVADTALLIACAVPVLSFGGLVAFPDAPLLLFHLLFVSAFLWALDQEHGIAWILCGTLLGLALLSKLMALATVVSFLVCLTLIREYRGWWRRPQPYLCLAAAFIVFLPYLLWNLDSGWIGLRTQLWDRHVGQISFSPAKPLEFAIEQLGAAWILVVPLWLGVRRFRSTTERVLVCLTVPVFGGFLLVSFAETHPHWTILGYSTAAILLAKELSARWRRIAFVQGFVVCGFLLAIVVGVPLFRSFDVDQNQSFISHEIAEAQRQLYQWEDLNQVVTESLLTRGGGRVFSFGYKRTGPLAYELRFPHVCNLRAYVRARKKIGEGQHLYIPLQELEGLSGVFVTDVEWITAAHLERIFESVVTWEEVEIGYSDEEFVVYRVFFVDYLDIERVREVQSEGAWRAL